MIREAYAEAEIEQLLKDYIVQTFLYEESKGGWENSSPLIESGIVNSLGILTLISFIGEQFGISIASEEMILENFKDVNSIKSLVLSKVEVSTQPVITQEVRERKLLSLVPVKPSGSKRPFFDIHGFGGRSLALTLANHLHPERPVYGLQAVGLEGKQAPHTCIEEMVSHYIQEIQTVQPEGSYLLGGLCIGGNIAFEIAQQLRKQGQQTSLVVMMDSPNPFWNEEAKREMANLLSDYRLSRREELIANGFSFQQIENTFRVQNANYQLIINHTPQTYSGRVAYFSVLEKITLEDELITQRLRRRFDPKQLDGWNSLAMGGIEVHTVSGSHMNFFKEPHVRVLAEKLNACLEKADQSSAVRA